jgi:pimeloyl-ACP methyl ester carboxylesterase
MGAAAFQDFDAIDVDVGETRIFLRRSGAGPAVLLLHGFPQTHLMWRRVAPLLARRFTVVCPDLRGYGRSGCPASRADHAPYAKRAMANDMVFAMEKLGFARFSVAGHDRGGRVAYRLALDHPERVERLAVLDVLSTADAWERADKRLATAFWPWSLLAQPEPLPERLVSSAPDAVIDDALGGWGSPGDAFDPRCARRISTRCAIPRASTRSVRNIGRRRHSTMSTTRRIAKPGGASPVPCSCSGVAGVRWIAGMPTRAALLPCGKPGQMMSAAERSMPATSFRRKFRSERRKS